jgi:ubiquinone/menaquinone biosynthesis C-methylase UbiE
MSEQPGTEATPFDDGVLYDLVLGNIDYGFDFYLRLAQAAPGPVLDIACGTGRILIPCMQAGVDIDGLDLHAGMLNRLRDKAAALGLEPRLYQADMASFQLPRRYSLIVIPFNAFVHCLTTDDQIAALVRCREHLEPGGMLALDTFFPGAALITQPDGTRDLELETTHPETGLPVRLFDTRTFDRINQQQHSMNELEMLDAAGNVATVHRSQTTIRWIYKTEMELLLRAASFDHWQIAGDFDDRPLVNETDAMIVKAWTGEGRN